jgi:hypothetical protein
MSDVWRSRTDRTNIAHTTKVGQKANIGSSHAMWTERAVNGYVIKLMCFAGAVGIQND